VPVTRPVPRAIPEERLTILPYLRCFIDGITARQQRNVDFRLSAITSSQISSLTVLDLGRGRSGRCRRRY
jgi:hypothetical protein